MRDENLRTIWDDVQEWLSDATRTAMREAENLTRRGRLKLDIMNLSRKIEKKLAELGGIVYERLSSAPDRPFEADGSVRELVGKIAKLESERRAKQKEFEAEKKRG